MKYAYDAGSINFCLMLGSSQILLLKKIRESLAGRVSIYELWPLMMSELFWNRGSGRVTLPLIDRLFSKDKFPHLFDDVPEVLIDKIENRCQEAEKHLLQWGSMPALLSLSDEERWKWLRDYEYTYLERDLGDLARLDDLMPFRTFCIKIEQVAKLFRVGSWCLSECRLGKKVTRVPKTVISNYSPTTLLQKYHKLCD